MPCLVWLGWFSLFLPRLPPPPPPPLRLLFVCFLFCFPVCVCLRWCCFCSPDLFVLCPTPHPLPPPPPLSLSLLYSTLRPGRTGSGVRVNKHDSTPAWCRGDPNSPRPHGLKCVVHHGSAVLDTGLPEQRPVPTSWWDETGASSSEEAESGQRGG